MKRFITASLLSAAAILGLQAQEASVTMEVDLSRPIAQADDRMYGVL